VKQEQQSIDALHEKRRKGVETAQKMFVIINATLDFDRLHSRSAQSNLTNKSRLQILHRREEQLQSLFEISREEVARFEEDEGRYSQFLEGAILQGYLQLLEPKVTLFSREQDVELVHKAGAAAAETYTHISGRVVALEVQATLNSGGYVHGVIEPTVL